MQAVFTYLANLGWYPVVWWIILLIVCEGELSGLITLMFLGLWIFGAFG